VDAPEPERSGGEPRRSERVPGGGTEREQSRRHLVLIGLMGAGKTTVGRRCAEALDRPFVDTDDLIVAQAGATVTEIFATEGEKAFRAREHAALADAIASPEPLVIACGGGAMVDVENRRAVRDTGFVVWLACAPDELAARVERDGTASRPLLAAGPTAATLARLEGLRAGTYEQAADARVPTDGHDVDAVTRSVLAAYRGACEGAMP
jgi:shikimate kinase